MGDPSNERSFSRHGVRAFSGEVDTGSSLKMRQNMKRERIPIQSNRNALERKPPRPPRCLYLSLRGRHGETPLACLTQRANAQAVFDRSFQINAENINTASASFQIQSCNSI